MENVSNILHNIIVQTFSAIKTNEEETRRKGKYTRINIISIGAVLSTLLLVLIAREICQLPHIHEINGRRQLSGGTSDEDNAFNEITLPSQDTAWRRLRKRGCIS